MATQQTSWPTRSYSQVVTFAEGPCSHPPARVFLEIFPHRQVSSELMALQFVFSYQQTHRHAVVYTACTNRRKKFNASSIPLPRMGHCSGLLLRKRQLLVFWWEAPITFLGQETAYFSKKRPTEKAWKSQILSSISALTGNCLLM